jgi:hypothetical protein
MSRPLVDKSGRMIAPCRGEQRLKLLEQFLD